MRLRCYVINVSLLAGLIQTAANVNSPCYLHFTPNILRIISPSGHHGVQIWATLDVDSVFSHYRIESHHDNEIILEVSAESLMRILRSAAGALDIMLRLGKRDQDPLLSWSIAMTSESGARLDVLQEVVVRILRASEQSLISEPMCPKPDVRYRAHVLHLTLRQVYIVMPPLSDVRAITDHMDALSPHISLGANHDGTFQLTLEDEDITGYASWTHLDHPNVHADVDQQQLTDQTNKTFYKVLLHVKALQSVLSCSAMARSTVACICSGCCAVFYVYLAGLSCSPGPTHSANEREARGILNVRYVPLFILLNGARRTN